MVREYGRRDVVFLAAAIGQDREAIAAAYGEERSIDISDLADLPRLLLQAIARYL